MTSPATRPPHIVFLDHGAFPKDFVFPKPKIPCHWEAHSNTAGTQQICQRAKHATIIVVNKVRLTAHTLAQLPRLEFIAVTATGTNHLDLHYCKKRRLPVSNVRDYGTASVAEQVMMTMLMLSRSQVAYQQAIAAKKWQQARHFCLLTHPIAELSGKTLTLIGKGVLGKAVGRLAAAFGLRVVFCERKGASATRPGYVPFAAGLRQADFISIHTPLTPETENLLAAQEISLMKKSAFLINTARGGIVNEAALKNALVQKKIAGAALDVLTQEPPPADHPLLPLALQPQKFPNFILTPHIAWGGAHSLQSCFRQVVENIENFVAGKPSRLVT